jgi:hypothetical protein
MAAAMLQQQPLLQHSPSGNMASVMSYATKLADCSVACCCLLLQALLGCGVAQVRKTSTKYS